jgi:hypothetical protein
MSVKATVEKLQKQKKQKLLSQAKIRPRTETKKKASKFSHVPKEEEEKGYDIQ